MSRNRWIRSLRRSLVERIAILRFRWYLRQSDHQGARKALEAFRPFEEKSHMARWSPYLQGGNVKPLGFAPLALGAFRVALWVGLAGLLVHVPWESVPERVLLGEAGPSAATPADVSSDPAAETVPPAIEPNPPEEGDAGSPAVAGPAGPAVAESAGGEWTVVCSEGGQIDCVDSGRWGRVPGAKESLVIRCGAEKPLVLSGDIELRADRAWLGIWARTDNGRLGRVWLEGTLEPARILDAEEGSEVGASARLKLTGDRSLRGRPVENEARLQPLPNDQELTVLGEIVDDGKWHWLRVEADKTGAEAEIGTKEIGWVALKFEATPPETP